MNETVTTNRESPGKQVLMVLLLLGVAVNLLLTVKLQHQVMNLGQVVPTRPDLPCAAIPTRFVMEEPVCAQKFIEAMNVSNFRVVTNESQLGSLKPKGRAP